MREAVCLEKLMSFDLTGIYLRCFAEPALQPSGLLIAVLAVYWSLVMFGAVDIEFLNWDFDLSLGGDGGALDFGLVPFRFLNLGKIPIMLWATVFSCAAWLLSLLIHYRGPPLQSDGAKIAEAFGLAVVFTKLATNPLRPIFEVSEPNLPETLIGRPCVISSLTATDQRGEASFATGAAPLILSIRTTGAALSKGQTATIVDYSQPDNTYIVSDDNEGDE